MKTIKLFFIKEDSIRDNDGPLEWLEWSDTDKFVVDGHNVRLYAWSRTKKEAKLFSQQRNIKKFIVKKIKFEDDEEYDRFIEQNRDSFLSIENFYYGNKTISFSLTSSEFDMVVSAFDYADEDFQDTCMMTDTMRLIFDISKRKYQKDLLGMGLFDIFDICTDISNGEIPEITVNIVNCMLDVYGFTFI